LPVDRNPNMAVLAQVTSGFYNAMAAPPATAASPDLPQPHDEWAAFRASLPLFVVSVGLFVGSAIVLWQAPSAGPGGFPLWGLLLTLGFMAAIGTTVSWFFANGPPAEVAPAAAVGEPRNGRPTPEVQRPPPVVPAPEWDESGIPLRTSATPLRAPARAPDPPPDDVVRALDEIAAIEEELETRPRSDPRRPAAPARS
jgi:hypothetical protein